ncbi:hypothetical protein BCY84_11464 [Trypanosoma cruzi cruzi]|nr:hypothetical protein BCY84_11464 [Trypanosoma cruzi cruzi]
MSRDAKPFFRRPTLADLVAGRQGSNVSQESNSAGTCQGVSVSSVGSTVPPVSVNTGGRPIYDVEEAGAHDDSFARMEQSGQWKLEKINREKLHDMFAKENGIRRDNVIRLLKKIGINSSLNDAALQVLFKENTHTESSILPEQWVALVEKLLRVQEDATEGTAQSNEVLASKPRNDEQPKNVKVMQRKDTVSSQRNREVLPERKDENKNNVSINNYILNETREHPGEVFEKKWITGSEATDIALLKLFIHCGALDRKDRGIELLPEDFRRVTYLRRNILPPKPIVWDAASKIADWCLQNSHSTSYETDDLCMKMSNFLDLLNDEFLDLTGGKVWNDKASNSSPPTVCMVLASLAPVPLQRLFGKEVVDHLCSPSTVQNVLKALGGSRGLFSTSNEPLPQNGKEFGIPPPLPPPASNNPQRPQVRLLPFSSSSACIIGMGGGGDEGCFTGMDGAGIKKKSPLVSYSVGSRSSSTLRGANGKNGQPRYMEPRPLDEISASIVARSKARRLIDELRKNAIPINRYECFARIDYVQRAIFDDASLGEEEEEEEEEEVGGNVSRDAGARAHRRHRYTRYRARPPDFTGPLLPGMYKMGGLGQPLQRRARQETFERLYRLRFGQVRGIGNGSGYRSTSLKSAALLASRSASERGTLAPGQINPVKVEDSKKVGCAEERPMQQADDVPTPLYQRRQIRGKMTRRGSRPPLMLANLFAKQIVFSPPSSQPPTPNCGTVSTRKGQKRNG